ncbi:hypothetical protein [Geomonas subterranea]|uniref:hypothetical protein n=1 Tax=Geomonas subterranea TaxID=2847989 RepID=UPI001CD44ED8|nr:hypothetical protein [Geomonas fuzhouensis]
MIKREDKARTVTVSTYGCRICEQLVVRHYVSAHDLEHDILGLNRLCMRCYLDQKYEPGSLVEGVHLSPTPEVKP